MHPQARIGGELAAARADVWASGAAYEPYIGRWSRRVAEEFVGWLEVPPASVWADVGCGTGALTQTILALAAGREVVALDASFGFASYARARVADARTSFAVADARALPWSSEGADAVVSGLVLNFVSTPERAVEDMARVAKRGGVVAAYVWDYAEGMQMLRRFWDAATSLDQSAASLDEGMRFPLCAPDHLAALWHQAGLSVVKLRAIEVPMRFESFEDFWTPFLGGQGPAPTYVANLNEVKRERLRETLRKGLTATSNEGFELTARAWAVKGTVPNVSSHARGARARSGSVQRG